MGAATRSNSGGQREIVPLADLRFEGPEILKIGSYSEHAECDNQLRLI
jgi:hypothetical protein